MVRSIAFSGAANGVRAAWLSRTLLVSVGTPAVFAPVAVKTVPAARGVLIAQGARPVVVRTAPAAPVAAAAHAAAPAPHAAHPVLAGHAAEAAKTGAPADRRRIAATVSSVNRGTAT
ncbi:MAG: hypothetical protein DIU75_021665 [Mycolicibacterium hassiacum]|jgi:hypothetical protein